MKRKMRSGIEDVQHFVDDCDRNRRCHSRMEARLDAGNIAEWWLDLLQKAGLRVTAFRRK